MTHPTIPPTAVPPIPPTAVGATFGDGPPVAVPGPPTDARPARQTAQSRAEPGGHSTPPAVALGEEAAAGGPTCCRACREQRYEGVGHSRRWALTDKGYAALGQVNVRIPSRAVLLEIAEQNRQALR